MDLQIEFINKSLVSISTSIYVIMWILAANVMINLLRYIDESVRKK